MMPSFSAFLGFVEKHIAARRVIVHCNQGQSRAPSLALLYLPKRARLIPSDSYDGAAAAFRASHYPHYWPGAGIRIWLAARWNEIT